jgi:hypothetical protein
MRLVGKAQPEFLMAARTRSLASWTAVSGSPTMVIVGTQIEQKYSVCFSFAEVMEPIN